MATNVVVFNSWDIPFILRLVSKLNCNLSITRPSCLILASPCMAMLYSCVGGSIGFLKLSSHYFKTFPYCCQMQPLQLSTSSILEIKHLIRSYNCPDYVLGLSFYFYEHCEIPSLMSNLHQVTSYDIFLGCLLLAFKLSFDETISNKTFSKYCHLPTNILCMIERNLLDQLAFDLHPSDELVIQCSFQMLSALYG